jgi:hypothetical protein
MECRCYRTLLLNRSLCPSRPKAKCWQRRRLAQPGSRRHPPPTTYPRPQIISVQSHTVPAQASTITQTPPHLVFDTDRRSRPTRQMMRPVALLAVALCATSSLAFLTPAPRPVRSRCGVRARILHMSGVERNPNFGKLMGGYVQVPWSDGRALSWHPSISASRSIG